MKNVTNILRRATIVFMVLLFSGCNSWLDVDPVGVQTSTTYWQTKEEVEQVLISSYIQLRACMPYFFKWGEIRGSNLGFGSVHKSDAGSGAEDERRFRLLDIRPSNSLTEWSTIYTAIGRANHVIQFAAEVREVDFSFSESQMNSFVAEAYFIRSLCYFYLVRTFNDVPFITAAYADDDTEFNIPKSKGDDILNALVRDLEVWKEKCKPGYDEEWQTKARATRWGFNALLADIYLWQENYTKVIEICDLLEKSGFDLETKENYFTIFYNPELNPDNGNGNNVKESIFELQFTGHPGKPRQTNDLFEWFHSNVTTARYELSKSAHDDMTEDVEDNGDDVDIRGLGTGGMFLLNTANKYWKYTGIEGADYAANIKFETYLRPDYKKEPNWIFYRYSEIVLMKAEAMYGMGKSVEEVCTLLDETLRNRAGRTNAMKRPSTKKQMYEALLLERTFELFAEGKRWFDVLRFARKNNYEFKGLAIDELTATVAIKDKPLWESRLQDVNGHYLPISTSEIKASYATLKQNPFYIGVE